MLVGKNDTEHSAGSKISLKTDHHTNCCLFGQQMLMIVGSGRALGPTPEYTGRKGVRGSAGLRHTHTNDAKSLIIFQCAAVSIGHWVMVFVVFGTVKEIDPLCQTTLGVDPPREIEAAVEAASMERSRP